MWVHKKEECEMLSAYAVLTISQPLSCSAGLDLVTLSDPCDLFACLFFMLNLDAFLWSGCLPRHVLVSYMHPALFIYIICQASGGTWVCDPRDLMLVVLINTSRQGHGVSGIFPSCCEKLLSCCGSLHNAEAPVTQIMDLSCTFGNCAVHSLHNCYWWPQCHTLYRRTAKVSGPEHKV